MLTLAGLGSFTYSLPLPVRSSNVRMIEGAAPVLSPDKLRDSLGQALDSNQKKYIALLGSTGSIGTQTLDICREYPDNFEVVSLAAGGNVDLLAQQIIEFRPSVVGLAAAEKEGELRDKLRAAGVPIPEIVVGPEGQNAVAVAPGADTVVTGVVGCAGLLPTIEAIKVPTHLLPWQPNATAGDGETLAWEAFARWNLR